MIELDTEGKEPTYSELVKQVQDNVAAIKYLQDFIEKTIPSYYWPQGHIAGVKIPK
jgi:hypothetical protein